MKTTNILFKALGYIIVLGGLTVLVLYATYPLENEWEHYSQDEYVKSINMYNMTEDQEIELIGKWKVAYKSLGGSIVYDIQKKGRRYNAFTYEMQDDEGYGEKMEAVKTLIINSFDGVKGKGIYKIEYEGKKYDVPCKIETVDSNTFHLSYDYYGYKDTEVWKREK